MSGPIPRAYALVLLVGLPLLAVREASLARGLDELQRAAVYLSAIVSSLGLAALTFGVAVWQGLPAGDLGWRVGAPGDLAAWAAGTAVAGLGLVGALAWVYARTGTHESPLLLALMPRTAAETGTFVLLSVVAAMCEEYVFRGFALRVVAAWMGSPWGAAAVVAVSFGLAHGYQRVGGVVRAAGLGMVLAVPVVITGSLYPAIVAHFWIDAVLGLWGWRWLLGEPEGEAA